MTNIYKCGSLYIDLASILSVDSKVRWKDRDKAIVEINGQSLVFFTPSTDSKIATSIVEARNAEWDLTFKRIKNQGDEVSLNIIQRHLSGLEYTVTIEAQEELDKLIEAFKTFKSIK
jgi:hypothetical protein